MRALLSNENEAMPAFIENYFNALLLADKSNEKVVFDHSGQAHKVIETSAFHFSGSQKVVSFTKNIFIQTTDACMVKSAAFNW